MKERTVINSSYRSKDTINIENATNPQVDGWLRCPMAHPVPVLSYIFIDAKLNLPPVFVKLVLAIVKL